MARVNVKAGGVRLRLNASEMKAAGLKDNLVVLPAGEQEVHEVIANHWYVKAHLTAPKKAPPSNPAVSVADKAKAFEKMGKKREKGETDEAFVARCEKEGQ